jgi:NDP-sugar pyrophosphorylase family protein
MIGLILSAGKGIRLGFEVVNKPKCLVRVNDKPVLELIANYLEKQGVQRIVVNLHMFPELVMKEFGQRFLYLYEPIPMGEYQTVNLVKGWFPGEDIMVINGDTIFPFEKESKHCGITYYKKDGSVEKVFNKKYIDIGTPEELNKARKLYGGD